MRQSLRICTIFFATLLLGGRALGAQWAYSAPASFDQKGGAIMPQEIFLKGDKLWVRLNVLNHTGKTLVVDKNLITAKLPDGRAVPRALGTFGHLAEPMNLMTGMSHALYIEYEIGKQAVPVTLQFEKGFFVDGQPVSLPDYPLTPIGKR